MANEYDAVVIGGGHNALVTAAYLARAGRRTLVLEARDRVGGAAETAELGGVRVPRLADTVGRRSRTTVRNPALPRYAAATRPLCPPPMTTAS